MNRRLSCIMLVEDCEADNYLHRKIIEDVGAADEIVIVRSGHDALQRIGESQAVGSAPPDLIFLDINTPGMEGWGFVEEFEKLDPATKAKSVIVMLTGSLDPDDRERARSIPLIKDYQCKPLSREALVDIVAKHCCG